MPASVSIRSPHKSKGRRTVVSRPSFCSQFQSAPLTKARGDVSAARIELPTMKFQSAPLTKARGDTSIPSAQTQRKKFQSAPLTKARGDSISLAMSHAKKKFQSAPLTKARGDTNLPCCLAILFGFNPLPSQKQGETCYRRHPCQTREVSIRSPHKSKGRQKTLWVFHAHPKFQSAPLTKARGDLGLSGSSVDMPSFNPLPSQKQGETSQYGGCGGLPPQFQSAPLTKARGDGFERIIGAEMFRFQSAPLTKARGD